jgi:hypothetical protein
MKNGGCFLLCTIKVAQDLHLAFADDLLGEWKMHPQNTIKSDITSARSAGEIFMYNNALFRPAQNCGKTYGGSIVINKITNS